MSSSAFSNHCGSSGAIIDRPMSQPSLHVPDVFILRKTLDDIKRLNDGADYVRLHFYENLYHK